MCRVPRIMETLGEVTKVRIRGEGDLRLFVHVGDVLTPFYISLCDESKVPGCPYWLYDYTMDFEAGEKKKKKKAEMRERRAVNTPLLSPEHAILMMLPGSSRDGSG